MTWVRQEKRPQCLQANFALGVLTKPVHRALLAGCLQPEQIWRSAAKTLGLGSLELINFPGGRNLVLAHERLGQVVCNRMDSPGVFFVQGVLW